MTREDILEAAAQVFRQKGFHGASMQDIAEAVNLQKASLYHHVSSKQEILLALLDRALELLLERISAISNQEIPADKKLQQMIRTYLQILAENTDLSSVLLFEHRSLGDCVGDFFEHEHRASDQARLRIERPKSNSIGLIKRRPTAVFPFG